MIFLEKLAEAKSSAARKVYLLIIDIFGMVSNQNDKKEYLV
jgi:hypothetical protein